MTADKEALEQAFRSVGERYGYEQVDAEFAAFRDFKVRWTRSIKWISFQVSDYLMDAPIEVLRDLATTLYAKITGSETNGYSKDMIDWVTSDSFLANKQPIYLRRSTRITKSHEGKKRDLNDSLERLKELGLVKKDDAPYLSWTREPLNISTGYCSTLMNVIVISSIFDKECIPDIVVDYALLHEYLMIREGRVTFGQGDPFDMNDELMRMPGWNEAEKWIRQIGLRI